MLVTLLIPCHDESEAIGPLFDALRGLPAWLDPHELEVVCVDDGSRDDTLPRLEELSAAATFPARVVPLSANCGIGAALRAGAAEAHGDVVVTYDADRPYPLEDVAPMVNKVQQGADVVTASPWHPDGAAEHIPFHRALVSKSASLLYRIRLGRRARGLKTLTCGFRAWKRPILLEALPRRTGYAATTEMLLNALRANARVVEFPSRLRARTEGKSKMRIMREVLGHLSLLLRG